MGHEASLFGFNLGKERLSVSGLASSERPLDHIIVNQPYIPKTFQFYMTRGDHFWIGSGDISPPVPTASRRHRDPSGSQWALFRRL